MIQELLTMYKKDGSEEDGFIETAIIQHYETYISKICSKYRNRHYYQDLKQELRIALMEGVRKYDINKSKAKFPTYVYSCLQNAIIRHIRDYQPIRVPEYLDWKDHKKDVVPSIVKTSKGTLLDVYDIVEYKSKDYSEFYHNLNIAKRYLKKDEYEQVEMLAMGVPSSRVAKKFNVTPQAMKWRMGVIRRKLKGKYEELI